MLANEKITSRTRLGFIGLGHLGSPIARRLIIAGFPTTVYDLNSKSAGTLAQLGAEVAPNPEQLAREVDVILSCLPDESSVEDVYLGKGNVLRSALPGTRIIELSTNSPKTARKLSTAARQYGIRALDVAVSGSSPAANGGNLTLFGGGEQQTFESSDAVFSAIAKQWFYMGPAGSGVAMKLVVNTLLGVGMQAIAEAVALGEGLDLPRDLLLDTLAKTTVVAPAHIGKLATAKKDDYIPQFPLRLMRKDFGLILAAAADFHLAMPATEAAAIVNDAENSTGGEEDFSAVIHRMEQEAGAKKPVPPAA
jgi:3-hydroxyisobutyrate dehydrogenase-like beta-hydroxyacid dehydrogenase